VNVRRHSPPQASPHNNAQQQDVPQKLAYSADERFLSYFNDEKRKKLAFNTKIGYI